MGVPAQLFGGGSDGSMRMEDWLTEMCTGCVHYTTEHTEKDPMAGFPCELPAYAYAQPYTDVEEWTVDAYPAGPDGVTCMAHTPRPVCAGCGRPYRSDLTPACRCTSVPCDGQLALAVTV